MPSPLPPSYLHKIYAGVLGKLIGVYLGRPFENWTYREILEKLGPIHYYVHSQFEIPLVVIDDDVSGTFAFVRALEEHGASAELTADDVGKTWLNAVIEKKTVFWWGGNGISTEHTTFLNLKKGIRPPESGSIDTNGRTLAEQIGAQIFIDGWALVAPGNPGLAVRLAEAAATVSHDGVAVHAAKFWAAMEAEAFVSRDVHHLLDTGLDFIPPNSLIAKLVADVRSWANEDGDWEVTRQKIEDVYGYDKFGGICHMVPNHAVMIMSLVYGGHDFSAAMRIVNTAGWDTDCNSGNVGCLVAIMHGLEGFENGHGLDWRGPLADRALISSADNGYSINNAARITYDLANLAQRLAGEPPLEPPKDGAQFHFSLPGSVQGFQTSTAPTTATIEQTQYSGEGVLAIHIHDLDEDSPPVEALTQTFTPLDVLQVNRDYEMMASPLIYPGQLLTAVVEASDSLAPHTSIAISIKAYDHNDTLISASSPASHPQKGTQTTIQWHIPATLDNKPIQQVGIAITSHHPPAPAPAPAPAQGTIYLHHLRWSGHPSTTLSRPPPASGPASFWQRAWVSSVDKVHARMGPSFYLAHDRGEGLFTQGTRDWTDYTVRVVGFAIHHLGASSASSSSSSASSSSLSSSGVVVRARGLNRYYGVVLGKGDGDGKGYVAIVKARDRERRVIARRALEWVLDVPVEIIVSVEGARIRGLVGGVEIEGEDGEYVGGGMGFVVGEGAVSAERIEIGVCREGGGERGRYDECVVLVDCGDSTHGMGEL